MFDSTETLFNQTIKLHSKCITLFIRRRLFLIYSEIKSLLQSISREKSKKKEEKNSALANLNLFFYLFFPQIK